MGTKVLILRALPWGSDSRATRWASIYASCDVIWGCWGARDPKHVDSNILNWRPKSGYLSFVVGYGVFILFSFFYALRKLRRDDILLCIDLETIILGLFAARIRGAKVHFDIADPFYLAKPVPFKKLWRWLEKQYIDNSDTVTAPHIYRLLLYHDKKPAHAYVVENVPRIKASSVKHKFLRSQQGSPSMTFGYFGALESHRGLEHLLELIKFHEKTQLIIAGRGPLDSLIRESAIECSRIQYLGYFNCDCLAEITLPVDVYYAIYEPTKSLHEVASPNKYYEHLVLGIPILCSKSILQANEVILFRTGWVIDLGLDALVTWYYKYRYSDTEFQAASSNAMRIWNKKYSTWLSRQQKLFNPYIL